MSEPAKDEKPAASGRGSRLMVVVAGLVALVIGGGAGAGAMYALGGSSEPAKTGEQAEADAEGGEHGEEAPKEAEEGGGEHGGGGGGGEHGGGEKKADGPPLPMLRGNRAVVNLGTFTVNLRGSGGGRVLRTEVQVEV